MGGILNYQEEVTKAMTLLAQDERTVFIGQQVAYPGSIMYGSLEGVPMEKRIEVPIMENTQMGMAIGMSLTGRIPICIYPRMDFLLLALDQLVNHLNTIAKTSDWRPKVIIRTMIGKKGPLYPGLQHCGDHTEALKGLLGFGGIEVNKVSGPEGVYGVAVAYRNALERNESTVIVEAG